MNRTLIESALRVLLHHRHDKAHRAQTLAFIRADLRLLRSMS